MRNVRVMNEEYDTIWGHIEDIILLLAIIIVFILKFIGIIKISWLWLLSIIWVPTALVTIFLIFAGLMGAAFAIYDKIKEKKDERN